METIAFRMVLHAGQRDEYERRHREIWPDLAALLHEAGISDYWIFLDEGTHHLFAVLKRTGDHKMDALPASEVMRRWWAYMSDIMETGPDGAPARQTLVPLFHLP
ncbi:L-rhamnose mutarotase [Trinickia caryophylli]|uniref:L-rhamnose mutarotase n=1 Tax=Trinickia caryophylli TaxID=28094 RepID=A0A1X7GG68_TRICW|nr:L-rhamnose mutarotase [Trinickia caryophylli]PMS10752.1 L-rhamnose mutarotase [Trinickia caryophylli]TRX13868.1 L-rhamnose mutarotase [Trinickia caryophylli]WQE15459.1 L-rhamnose mutarotase [Trinickia caryophylli]SMF68633.1 L-rhamnose mutarotase [Trinickia caryophylli]GLU33799.1 L-rhamnose mutarotase [Trinickia caryophylli]